MSLPVAVNCRVPPARTDVRRFSTLMVTKFLEDPLELPEENKLKPTHPEKNNTVRTAKIEM